MADTTNNIDLDLDALSPAQVNISYKERIIAVEPPNLEQFSKIYALGTELSKLDQATAQDADILPIYSRVKSLIDECVPDLAQDNLNPLQLMSVFRLLADLATPQDKALKELADRGISLKGAADPKAEAEVSTLSAQ